MPRVVEDTAAEITLYLDGLQSPINIGSILRVAETYAAPVTINDRARVLGDPGRRQTVSDFSCGALSRGAWRTADAPPPGRLIATCLVPGAADLADFRFESGDVVAIGNEYDGLSADLIRAADVLLTIGMPATFTPKLKSANPIDPGRVPRDESDGAPVLSAAMSAGIVCYAAFIQRRWRSQGDR